MALALLKPSIALQISLRRALQSTRQSTNRSPQTQTLSNSLRQKMDPDPPPKDKKGPAPGTLVCGNCLAPQGSASAPKLSACTRCGLVSYCSKDCQRAHWKVNHKQFCVAKAARAPPPQGTPGNAPGAASEERRRAAAKAAAAGEECAICLDPLTEAVALTLPCSHVFHTACVEKLRKFGLSQACPLCRAVTQNPIDSSEGRKNKVFFQYPR